MSAVASAAGPVVHAAPHPIRVATEARDYEALARTLAKDVVIRSPVTATPFVGDDAVALLVNVVQAVESWEVLEEIPGPRWHLLVIRAQIGGRTVQYIDTIRHDEEGLIKEIVIYGRPISDMAVFAKAVAPRLARRRSRVRAVAVALLTAPMPQALARGDRLISRLALSSERAHERR